MSELAVGEPPVIAFTAPRTPQVEKQLETRLFWEKVYAFFGLNDFRSWVVKAVILPSIGRSAAEEPRAFTRPNGLLQQRLTIQTADGVNLDTVQLLHPDTPQQNPAEKKWIVYFHGNGDLYEESLPALERIAHETGANVYTGNYRGVGQSEGFPWMAEDLVLDGDAMVERLLTEGVLPENIVIHGWSMGGGVGAQVAAKHPGVHFCSERSFASFTREVEGLVKHISSVFFLQNNWMAALGYLLAPLVYLVRKIGMLAVLFFGWQLDSAAAWNKITTGRKIVLFHPCDGVIPYWASLYRSLKRSQMSISDWIGKIGRELAKALGRPVYQNYSTTYKPEHIRLLRVDEPRRKNPAAKQVYTLKYGQNCHCEHLTNSQAICKLFDARVSNWGKSSVNYCVSAGR